MRDLLLEIGHERFIVGDRWGEVVKELDTWVTNCSPNPKCDVFFNVICDDYVGRILIAICKSNKLDMSCRCG